MPSPARPYLVPLDQYDDDAPITGLKRYFQYWPEDITDNKGTNYENKNIPGLSHPIYQWISGAQREIGFTAIFTRDRPITASEQADLDAARNAASSALTSFSSVISTFSSSIQDNRNVNIPSAVGWLRSFEYPDYSADGNGHASAIRAKPPQKLILGMPGMDLAHSVQGHLKVYEMVCLMTQCDVTYSGFFYDGSPRIARVQLQFVQTIQFQGRVNQVDAFAVRSFAYPGYNMVSVPKRTPGT